MLDAFKLSVKDEKGGQWIYYLQPCNKKSTKKKTFLCLLELKSKRRKPRFNANPLHKLSQPALPRP
tara:strand:- start:6 stop:203 length:198 start_codon:yes stop_codon:yes gene_type:complete